MTGMPARFVLGGMLLFTGLIATFSYGVNAQSSDARYFPETKHSVKGVFLKYWLEHGGLAQQGFPISEEFMETSELDGKQYTVQYFERAVFEKHPENAPPFDVLLSQLGTFQYRARYGEGGAPGQQVNTQSAQRFPETGYSVGGSFLEYWKANGGLAQQGFPISNEFVEKSELDGKEYTVQYFERAVFEWHPENQPQFRVLLSQLGTFQAKKKYPGGVPGGEGQPQPTGGQPTSVPLLPTATRPVVPPAATAQPSQTPSGTNCEAVSDIKKARISSNGPVKIDDVKASGQEYVVVKNTGTAAANISGWVLRDKNDPEQSFSFPGGTQVAAGASLQVYTEPGHPYTFSSRSSIWNNCGDALELVDGTGVVRATYAYGTHILP